MWHGEQGSHILGCLCHFDFHFDARLQEDVFDVYTDVAAHVKWINDTILSMGGMQSCGYTLEKILSEGELSVI